MKEIITKKYETSDGEIFTDKSDAILHEYSLSKELKIKYFRVSYSLDDFSGMYQRKAVAAVLSNHSHGIILNNLMASELGSSVSKLADGKNYPTWTIRESYKNDFIKHETEPGAFSGWGANHPRKIFLAPVSIALEEGELGFVDYFKDK